ncbi:SWIM zinc finger family protein [Natrinema amylolyticum]|uniref:SWIM zinc finger family protein n=1 Tax=Natrinema amylolyticum TaxID=2878679 RepID=UPI001CFB5878|nr:SWIM zinc finger family protein [Natrinema amylolyticum]
MSTDRSIHREQQEYHHDRGDTTDREQRYSGDVARLNGHELIAIDEWLPGREPTPYEIDLIDGYEYRTRYWRCRNCGQERNRRDEFRNQCETPVPSTPLEDGGYSVDDPRTRRALSEGMDVRFATLGARYEVVSVSGNTYEVDIEGETCTCPDFEYRQPDDGCKHLRRVDLEIRTGLVPAPDGTFSH